MLPFVIAFCKISNKTCCKADKIIIIDKTATWVFIFDECWRYVTKPVRDFGDRIENNKKLFQGQVWSGAIVRSKFTVHSTSPIISLAWSLLVCSYLIHDNCFTMIIFCVMEQMRGFNVAKRSSLEESLAFSITRSIGTMRQKIFCLCSVLKNFGKKTIKRFIIVAEMSPPKSLQV